MGALLTILLWVWAIAPYVAGGGLVLAGAVWWAVRRLPPSLKLRRDKAARRVKGKSND